MKFEGGLSIAYLILDGAIRARQRPRVRSRHGMSRLERLPGGARAQKWRLALLAPRRLVVL